jgi:hypothetical protein
MTTREMYYHLRHVERLLSWQIAQAEKEMARVRAERRERVRAIRQAYKSFKLGINRVRKANVEYYNRQIARGY